MEYTTNLGLKKPAYSDPVDVADMNGNMDIIDELPYALAEVSMGGNLSVRYLGTFGSGGINGYDFYPYQKYRCSSIDVVHAKNDIRCHVANGFRFGWASGNAAGTELIAWSGWFTSDVTIPKGTYFRFQIARVLPENLDEIADIIEFTSAITFDTEISNLRTDVDSLIEYKNDIGYRPESYNIVQGTIDSTGVEASDPKRVRTSDFIPYELLSYGVIKRKPSIAIKYGIHFYDGNKTHLSNTDWLTSDEYEIEPVANCKYVKMVFTYSTDGIIAPSNVNNVFKIYTPITDVVNLMIKADERTGHSYSGEKIPSKVNKFDYQKLFRMSYTGNTSQDIECFDDYLFVAFSVVPQIRVYSLDSYELLATLSIETHHGSSMQFSNEKYSQSDRFPLLYVGGWNDNKISVIRITEADNVFGAEIIRTLYLPTDYGYYLAPSIDKENNILYAYGHSTSSIPNADEMKISKWDLDTLTENEDGTYTPDFISVINSPNIGTYQGYKFFGGRLYVGATDHNAPYNPRFVAIDTNNGDIVSKVDLTPVTTSELEGLCYRIEGNEISWIVTEYYDVFQLKF